MLYFVSNSSDEQAPVLWVVLDENHYSKKLTVMHYALNSIFRENTHGLSATFIDNEWTDGYGAIISELQRHLFKTKALFEAAFCSFKGKRKIALSALKVRRLQKFLQAFCFARPPTVLKLPGLNVEDIQLIGAAQPSSTSDYTSSFDLCSHHSQ